MEMQPTSERPNHVPDHLVRDFDLYQIPGTVDGYCDDVHALWKQVQDDYPDIFWTPRYGGHWVATRYAEINALTTDVSRFSNVEPFIPIGVVPHTGPSQLDAPDHAPFRKLLAAAFTPHTLSQASIRARAVAQQLVEEIRPRGRCNFMRDFIGVMPIITFLNLLGMPESEADYLKSLAARLVPGQPGIVEAQAESAEYIRRLIADRQRNPGGDFVSGLVRAQVLGREMTDDERFSVVNLVVVGGLDTVINMTSFAATHFARNPDVQHDLRDHPEIYDGAVDEITRRFGPSNLARLVRYDTQLAGVDIRRGEQVLGIYPLAGLDERVNPDPMRFDPRRKGGRHLNFGSGPHTCIGARLARREIRIFLEEWMHKMPEFAIVAGTGPRMSSGLINSMRDLYLEW